MTGVQTCALPICRELRAIDGSQFSTNDARLLVLLDGATKDAVYVEYATNSPLSAASNTMVVVDGMAVTLAPEINLHKKNVPSDVRVSNILVHENMTPPGWVSTWGLMILGPALLAGGNFVLRMRQKAGSLI